MFNVGKIKIIIMGLICCGLVFLGVIFYSQGESGKLEVVFFDVGQGDAALIKSPYGQKILIDGGPDQTILGKLANEIPFYDKVIDLVVLTHPHSDHVSGLVEVLKKYQVDKVMLTGVVHTTKVYEEFLRSIQAFGIDVVYVPDCAVKKDEARLVCAPQQVVLGDGLEMQIVWPKEYLVGLSQKNLNNSSIVVKLNYGQVSFLLAGDIEKEAENELSKDCAGVAECNLLGADVLKVAHQGSDSSSQGVFVEQVSPKYAIISVGKNSYGHPSPGVIKRLEDLKAEILRTDVVGDIRCVSSEQGVDCLGE